MNNTFRMETDSPNKRHEKDFDQMDENFKNHEIDDYNFSNSPTNTKKSTISIPGIENSYEDLSLLVNDGDNILEASVTGWMGGDNFEQRFSLNPFKVFLLAIRFFALFSNDFSEV